MNQWLEYEKLVARIYQDLWPKAKVTHNDKIKGRDSGIERQIDVSIRDSFAGHEILVIVQAKNYSRPADINTVGELKAVVQDVGASKGVLICNAGFSENAIEYARNLGIDLCSVHDAMSRDWSIDFRIPLIWRQTFPEISIDLILLPDLEATSDVSYSNNPQEWKFEANDISIMPFDIFVERWNKGDLERTCDSVGDFSITDPSLRFIFIEGYSSPCQFVLQHKTRCVYWLKEFKLEECRGILNQIDQKLTLKFSINSTDIPFRRDESWQFIENAATINNLMNNSFQILIEENEISSSGLKIDFLNWEVD